MGLRSSVVDTEIAMKTIGEKTELAGKPKKLHDTPRLQDVMAIAQREQANAFTRFYKSWRRARRPHDQEAPATHIAFGAR